MNTSIKLPTIMTKRKYYNKFQQYTLNSLSNLPTLPTLSTLPTLPYLANSTSPPVIPNVQIFPPSPPESVASKHKIIPTENKFSYGHIIPMELVNKILLMREPHPIAKLIKERNYNVCYIEWRNKNTGFISRGQLIMLDNSKKYRGIKYWQGHIKDINKEYPHIHHKLVFPFI